VAQYQHFKRVLLAQHTPFKKAGRQLRYPPGKMADFHETGLASYDQVPPDAACANLSIMDSRLTLASLWAGENFTKVAGNWPTIVCAGTYKKHA